MDPSGHFDNCSALTDRQCAIDNAWTLDVFKQQITAEYGVTLSGSWSKENARIMYQALNNMNNEFSGRLNEFPAGTTFSFKTDPNSYGGQLEPNGIAFHSFGLLPFQNIYHEVGHLINQQTGNFFTYALNNKVYDEFGRFVMGGPDNNYHRNSGGYNQSRINDPSGLTVDAEQHTATPPCNNLGQGWCDSGNSTSEEWADLVANYVANNFSDDPAGQARQDWVGREWAYYMFYVTR